MTNNSTVSRMIFLSVAFVIEDSIQTIQKRYNSNVMIVDCETEGSNMNNNENSDEYVPEELDLSDCPESDILCPECIATGRKQLMRIATVGNGPDDYTTVLICPECKYREEE